MAEKKNVIEAQRVIIRTDTREIFDNFIKRISEIYALPVGEMPGPVRELAEDIESIKQLAHKFLEPHLSVGSLIVPPEVLGKVYRQKLHSIVISGESMVHGVASAAVTKVKRAVKTKDMSAIKEAAREYARFFKYLFHVCAALYITAQVLFSLVSINTPSKVRPPLSNILMGYDIVE